MPETETASVAARHESAAPVPAPLHAAMPGPLPAALSTTLPPPPVGDAAASAKTPLKTGSSSAPGPEATVAVAAAPETSAVAPEAVAAVPETPVPAPEVATPAPVPDEGAPSDEQDLEPAEPVPDEAVALGAPDKSGERPVQQPASTVRAVDPSPPPLASAARAIESWHPPAPQRAMGLRVGIAAVLVGAGFILGRLTAPTPSVTSRPVAAEPPMAAKASPVEALTGGNAAPIETTAPVSTAGVAPPSVPDDPVTVGTPPASANGPGTALPAPAHASAPAVALHAGTAVRTAAPPRSGRVEPAEVTTPTASGQLNPFVQAVQDDIKEDEAEAAARKKRAVSPQ
jgi:hypothetical protein